MLDLEAQNVEHLQKMKDEHTIVTKKLQDDLEEQFLAINNTLEQVLDDKEAKIRDLEKKIENLNEHHNKVTS